MKQPVSITRVVDWPKQTAVIVASVFLNKYSTQLPATQIKNKHTETQLK